VLTYAAPEGARARAKNIMIKVSGAFDTEAQASEHAKKINAEDPQKRFDVFVCKMYTWGSVPIPEDYKVLMDKEYNDKQLNAIMKGQQESLRQSKKEMDERIARDRAKAEEEIRRKYGPNYVMAKKSDTVREYEKQSQEREAQSQDMNFSHRELMESVAHYIQSTNGRLDPEVAGDLMRFLETRKIVEAMSPEELAAAKAKLAASSSQDDPSSSSSSSSSSQ
jgi:hypothetical protein